MGNALGQAVMVAQIDEQHTAMVANPMAPAGQTNRLVDMAFAERAAGVGPVTMHGYPNRWSGRIAGAKARPAKRLRVYPTQTRAATTCASRPSLSENDANPGKVTKKQRSFWTRAAAKPIV